MTFFGFELSEHFDLNLTIFSSHSLTHSLIINVASLLRIATKAVSADGAVRFEPFSKLTGLLKYNDVYVTAEEYKPRKNNSGPC